MKFETAYDTVKSDEMFNGESAPAAPEINTIAAAEVFVAGEKPDVPVESEAAASVGTYEDKFEEIENQMNAVYDEAKAEIQMPDTYDPGIAVQEPSVEIKEPEESVHTDLPEIELVVPESESIEVKSDFVLEVPEADPVEHVAADIELVMPDVDPVEHFTEKIELVVPETDIF